MKNIICLLTVNPKINYIKFCETLVSNQYDIYICVDDNSYQPKIKSSKVKFIQLNNLLCENCGYRDTVRYCPGSACSRDKALYFFCNIVVNYRYLWLIEEDVFIPNLDTIRNIDNTANNQDIDLLCKENDIIYDVQHDWHWDLVNSQIKISLPYARSLVCAIRCSKKMMKCIKKYAATYQNLFYCEVLFNTLAIKNDLKIKPIHELSGIKYNYRWTIKDIQKNILYHPIKNTDLHDHYRKKFITF